MEFFEPAQDPVAQANLVLQQIGTPGFGDLPPALDVEVTGNLSSSALATAIQTWVATVQSALGRVPIIYTGASFWTTDVGSPASFSSDMLWIANWNVSCPNVPSPWQSWVFWQYSDNGSVSGVGTSVDQDQFNGTLADLQKLTVPPVPPGTPLAWGEGQLGELGDGTFHTTSPFGSSTAVHVTGLSGVTAVAGGYQHNLALRSDGTVWAWGSGGHGELGNNVLADQDAPSKVLNLSGVAAIAAGYQHSMALKSDGTVWVWGSNGDGQSGNGTDPGINAVPVQVSGLSDVAAIGSGGYHCLAIKTDGTVWVWGRGLEGQLGNGAFQDQATPVQLIGLSGISLFAGGAYHTLVLKSDGTVLAWGRGAEGQLGNGLFQSSSSPVSVSGLSGVVAVACGFEHSLAVKSDGTVRAWGRGLEGQLGNGLFQNSATPVQVSSLSGASSVAAGSFQSLALKSDHTVSAWGAGNYGQLGNGTFYSAAPFGSGVPVQATSLPATKAISAGFQHGLALPLDNQPPVALCQNVTVPAGTKCVASASIDNGSYDPDPGDQIVSFTQDPSGPYSLGSTLVTLTVVDTHGASSSCQATVNVVDLTPPALACPAAVTISADANCAANVPDLVSGTTATDCSSVSLSQSPAVGTRVGLGANTVTVTAEDTAGNTSTCTTTVTVIDTTPPALTCPAAVTISANANCAAGIPDLASSATATDCNGPVVVTQSPTAGTSVGLGATTVTVTAKDAAGNTSTCTTTVTVIDTTPPTLACPAAVTINANANCAAGIPDLASSATATDCNGPVVVTQSPTAGTSVGLGATTVTVSAKDAAGNTSTCTTTVTVIDTTPPTLACAEDTTVTADGNGSALIPNVLTGATASDCDGPVNLTQSPVAGTSVGLGSTPITVTATDAAGNATTCNTICTVVASGLTIQSVSGPAGPLALGTMASVTVQFTDSEANPDHTLLITWDDGNSTSLQNLAPGSYPAQHQYAGAGVYSIGITVTAPVGRNATATFTYILVYDPTAGFVTGGGWIQSPAGAYLANPGLVGKAEFGFNSKYAKGATVPSGQTNFKFETAGFRFDSQVYQWLVVSGAKAQYKGSGTVNDPGNYGFILTATDGQNGDTKSFASVRESIIEGLTALLADAE